MYAAFATLVVGLAGGLLVDRSAVVRRWIDAVPAIARPERDAATGGSLAMAGDGALTVVDRAGRMLRAISAERPWTPRFSPTDAASRTARSAMAVVRATSG